MKIDIHYQDNILTELEQAIEVLFVDLLYKQIDMKI